MRIDVALVPSEARRWGDAVHIVLDELRASLPVDASAIVPMLVPGAPPYVEALRAEP